jgi:hypothetical protein
VALAERRCNTGGAPLVQPTRWRKAARPVPGG